MAVIETNTKSSLHLRSNSLPSSPHPLVSQFEDNLKILNNSEGTTSLSSSSVCNKLNGMQDLNDCIGKLLQLPTEQQALSRECNERSVNDLLEGSLRILDICSIAKDFLSLSKENMYELQSVIRRKRGIETGFTVEGVKYMAFRKNMKKQIRKALVNLKTMKNESIDSSSNKDNNSSPMFGLLKEAEAVTLYSLEHLLLFISDPKGHSKHSRWSIISKLMHSKRAVSDSQESDTNEFEKVDSALLSLISHNKTSSADNFQSHMENLEICIQDLEIGVEHISRKLIRNRVSLLNIFNH
ncbi:hypothetical protein MtrunA17_Chr4g0035231 [Medicago truncatula]|uniref:DUF241 domain protein n=1 Tax=Medicago truncatula TaxID=3880 RepID=G7JHD9_MEDTR|nr:uncharacterized protein LOC11413939 [Medicago truncatula]AES89149.1 DUF241 domain protein [Medicago truncatula]RHN61309.1 hypothetical protein MtrunA17_Chr4g0035231 [Medicago truncatula]